MKNKSSVFVFGIIVIAFLTIAAIAIAGEGTKTLVFLDGTKIVVPEKAPDFNKFSKVDLLGNKVFQNGNQIQLVGLYNDDETITVMVILVLYARTSSSGHIVAFAVRYDKSPWQHYEDTVFMKTREPSDRLIRVGKEPDVKKIINFMSSYDS